MESMTGILVFCSYFCDICTLGLKISMKMSGVYMYIRTFPVFLLFIKTKQKTKILVVIKNPLLFKTFFKACWKLIALEETLILVLS